MKPGKVIKLRTSIFRGASNVLTSCIILKLVSQVLSYFCFL